MTAPATDSQLPSAGQTITGFYDLNQNKVGQVDNYVTKASNYGDQSETWSGVDVNLNAACAADCCCRAAPARADAHRHLRNPAAAPGDGDAEPILRRQDPWLTQVKFVASYTVPRVDVHVSGTLQNLPGPALSATYVVANALVQPSLGRPLSGAATPRQ